MTGPVQLVEIWRGEFLESVHAGHVVVCDRNGSVLHAWGDPDAVILPRSSVKMIQALPLVESGAADAAGLTERHLALACASHVAQADQVETVQAWLAMLGLSEDDLLCGPQPPRDKAQKFAMIRSGSAPRRIDNNCSGKHAGFLTLNRHLGAGPDYVAPDHPIQQAILEAFQDVTQTTSPGFGIDGCSAPNYATTLGGLARAMAFFATARPDAAQVRERAAFRLRSAMAAHPGCVAGNGCACTELMQAATGGTVVKTGAEGVYTAMLPERGLGVALKIADGATRASEAAIASLLVRLGAAAADNQAVRARMTPEIRNFAGDVVGMIRPAPGLAP